MHMRVSYARFGQILYYNTNTKEFLDLFILMASWTLVGREFLDLFGDIADDHVITGKEPS